MILMLCVSFRACVDRFRQPPIGSIRLGLDFDITLDLDHLILTAAVEVLIFALTFKISPLGKLNDR